MVKVTIQWEAMKMLIDSTIECPLDITLRGFQKQVLSAFWEAWSEQRNPNTSQHGFAKYVTVSTNGEQIYTDEKLQQLLQTHRIFDVRFLHPGSFSSITVTHTVGG